MPEVTENSVPNSAESSFPSDYVTSDDFTALSESVTVQLDNIAQGLVACDTLLSVIAVGVFLCFGVLLVEGLARRLFHIG